MITASALAAATLPALGVSSPAAAGTTDCPLTPQVSDVMISQGLPSYKEFVVDGKKDYKLVRGKTAVVKYFLRLPSCAPEATQIRVTGGQLFVTISPAKVDSSGKLLVPTGAELLATASTNGPLPAPPVGPTATAPVPEAGSDPLFVVPGSALRPSSLEEKRVYFAAALTYQVGGSSTEQTLNLVSLPGSSEPVSRVIDRDVRPMRVLVVPMGDAGTVQQPKTFDSQFPLLARTELERGLKGLSRVLPVPDYNAEPLTSKVSGLRAEMSAGLLTLGPHAEGKTTVNYMPNDGPYCGDLAHFAYIGGELQKRRTAHNSANPDAQAEFAYGAIWQDRSLGASTGTTSPSCAEGAGSVPGREAWGRLVAPVPDGRAGVSASLAAMELAHNAGRVPDFGDPRFETGFHSKNTEADITAPDRAWNTLERKWISQDRSVMRIDPGAWNDRNTLLEAEDWNAVHCLLTSATCGTAPTIGLGAAGGSSGTFYVSGSFVGLNDDDKKNDQVDVSTYYLESGQAEVAGEPTAYRFVQWNVQSNGKTLLSQIDLPVHSAVDAHGAGAAHPDAEVFGVQLPAAKDVNRIEIYRGDIKPENLLYERQQGAVPDFLSVHAANRTASVTATGAQPAHLRLDLFLRCPTMTSPLAVDVHPIVAADTVATFTTTYDTSLGCGDQGELLYRLTDGYLTKTQKGLTNIADGSRLSGVAAIYTPTAGVTLTQHAPIPLAGAARDGAGVPADRLEWRLARKNTDLPKEPTFVGDVGSVPVPALGFAAGEYDVVLTGFRAGSQVVRTSSSLVVLADGDRDIVPDPIEPPCYPNAIADPANAARDSDRDGAADVVDATDVNRNGLIDILTEAAPCTSRSTANVVFAPDKLQKGSSGVPVTLRLKSPTVDLVELKKQGENLFITRVAGYRTMIAAETWSVEQTTSGPVATAKFSRAALSAVLISRDLLGYIPVFAGTADERLSGADPQYPIVFP